MTQHEGLKRILLAAASALAILSAVPEAGATTWTFTYIATEATWTAPGTGVYTFDLYGAQGGAGGNGTMAGGLGAEAGGGITLTQGTVLTIFVGEQGHASAWYGGGGGGGGGSFVLAGTSTLAAAGGGGGGGAYSGGGVGLSGRNGGNGG